MKKKIEDYKDQQVAIQCSNQEEWNKIIDLIKPKYCKKEYYKKNPNSNTDTIYIKGEGWANREAFQNETVYPASDFLEKDSDFIFGKWYTYNNMYAKCIKHENDIMYSSCHIIDSNYYPLDNYSFMRGYRWTLLENLDKIQKYLPEGHIDKIVIPEYVKCIYSTDRESAFTKDKIYKCNEKTTLDRLFLTKNDGIKGSYPFNGGFWKFEISNKEDYDLQNKPKQLIDNLIEGEFYYHIENKNIVKWKNSQPKYYLGNHSTDYNNGSNGNFNNEFTEFRLATSEEKKWLNTCIAQNKFISKNDLHLYDDSGLLIPAQKCEECNDTGKVMKAKLYPSGHTEVWEDCEKCQEKEETIFKKGDYIYVLGGKTTTGKDCKDKVIKIESVDLRSLSNPYAITDYEKCGGIYFTDIRLATTTEIDTLYIHKKEIKYLLEEARKRYPIGTKVKSLFHRGNPVLTIKNTDFDHCRQDGIHVSSVEGSLAAVVYENGNWAEIISEKEWIPKAGEWVYNITGQYSSIRPNPCQITKIDNSEVWCKDFNGESYLSMNDFLLKYRKAKPDEIPNESFQIAIYNPEEIHMPSITKNTKKIQTITIESIKNLNLNLTKIKSKQIQTIKI